MLRLLVLGLLDLALGVAEMLIVNELFDLPCFLFISLNFIIL